MLMLSSCTEENYAGFDLDFHVSGPGEQTSSGHFFPPHKSRLRPLPSALMSHPPPQAAFSAPTVFGFEACATERRNAETTPPIPPSHRPFKLRHHPLLPANPSHHLIGSLHSLSGGIAIKRVAKLPTITATLEDWHRGLLQPRQPTKIPPSAVPRLRPSLARCPLQSLSCAHSSPHESQRPSHEAESYGLVRVIFSAAVITTYRRTALHSRPSCDPELDQQSATLRPSHPASPDWELSQIPRLNPLHCSQ